MRANFANLRQNLRQRILISTNGRTNADGRNKEQGRYPFQQVRLEHPIMAVAYMGSAYARQLKVSFSPFASLCKCLPFLPQTRRRSHETKTGQFPLGK